MQLYLGKEVCLTFKGGQLAPFFFIIPTSQNSVPKTTVRFRDLAQLSSCLKHYCWLPPGRGAAMSSHHITGG